MNTNPRILPIRDCLAVDIAISGIRIERNPRPGYLLVFRLNLLNKINGSIRLEGRKWILRESNGHTRVIEAAHVFNQQPVLTPGAVFSYGGCQNFLTPPAAIELSFFGTDSRNHPFITPPFIFPKQAFALPWKHQKPY